MLTEQMQYLLSVFIHVYDVHVHVLTIICSEVLPFYSTCVYFHIATIRWPQVWHTSMTNMALCTMT